MRILILTLLLHLAYDLSAQGLAGARNLDPAVLVSFGYGPFTPAADLEERFSGGTALELGVDWLVDEKNWEFGVVGSYGFGGDVKEDVLANLRTEDDFIIGNQRGPADVQLRQRHLFLAARAGYTLGIGDRNLRAGLKLSVAAGWLAHWIRIQDDPVQSVVGLNDTARPGYDRLTGGPAVRTFLGYQQLALNRRLNFYAGGELLAGFTRARRDFDFALGTPSPEAGRTDIVLGLRIGLILPFYRGEGREIFY